MEDPYKHIEAVENEFKIATDRAAAVVAGAFIESLIELLLKEFFVEDNKSDKKVFMGYGPLATFSSKIEISYRLGLITKNERNKLHTIRSIRNEFAHTVGDLSFSDQSISDKCKNISVPVELLQPDIIPLPQKGEKPEIPKINKAAEDDFRGQFQESVMYLMQLLLARSCHADDNKCKQPKDFLAAHEPTEQILYHFKRMCDRSRELIKKLEELGRDSQIHLDDLKIRESYIPLQEFRVEQIKAAHLAREKEKD